VTRKPYAQSEDAKTVAETIPRQIPSRPAKKVSRAAFGGQLSNLVRMVEPGSREGTPVERAADAKGRAYRA
jgi:hypothetical protein